MTALLLCLLIAPPEDPRQSVVDRAAAAPPEIAADLFIKVAESGYPLDKKKRLEMLEDAWRMAGLAKMEMPPKMAVNGMNTDTDAGRILGGPRLDKLTLRVKAIRAMRQGVVQSCITFLNGAAMKQESPAEWLLAFDYSLRSRSADTGAAEGSVEAEVRRSGDGLMNLILDAREVLKAK